MKLCLILGEHYSTLISPMPVSMDTSTSSPSSLRASSTASNFLLTAATALSASSGGRAGALFEPFAWITDRLSFSVLLYPWPSRQKSNLA